MVLLQIFDNGLEREQFCISALQCGSQPFLTFLAVRNYHDNSLFSSHLVAVIKSKYYITMCFSNWRLPRPNSVPEECKTEHPIQLSEASRLLQDLEKPSTLVRTIPPPTNMEERKSMGGKKGPRKSNPVSEVSPRLGPSDRPAVKVASPLTVHRLQAILQTHQVFGCKASEGHEDARYPLDFNPILRTLWQFAYLRQPLNQVLSPGVCAHTVCTPCTSPTLTGSRLWPVSRTS